jgi:hypothetical protein
MIIMDKLKSYGAAKREILLGVDTAIAVPSLSAVSTPIGQHANGSIACRDSHRAVMCSVFSRRKASLPNTSAPSGICCLHPRTVKR